MSFVQTKKAGLIGQIRAGGICVGGGNCLKYLKRGGTEKRGEYTKILKREDKLDQGVGALKKWGLEPPYELCLTNVIFSGTFWRDK